MIGVCDAWNMPWLKTKAKIEMYARCEQRHAETGSSGDLNKPGNEPWPCRNVSSSRAEINSTSTVTVGQREHCNNCT